MSYETRAYDKANTDGFQPDPVVVLVATGTNDVSRLVYLLSRGLSEQCELSAQVLRQVRRHNAGRSALKLLAAHGGPDLLSEVGTESEPTEDYVRALRNAARWAAASDQDLPGLDRKTCQQMAKGLSAMADSAEQRRTEAAR